jgi:hypothetical protein
MLRKTLTDSLRATLAPRQYLRNLGFNPFPWQDWALDQSLRRVLLNCCRQAGKSTVIAAKASHKARFYPGSLILLISPSERQSKELMKKVEDFYKRDPGFPQEKENNQLTKEFTNRSRIVALPGSEKTVRGFSGPTLIIIDEASRVPDELYKAIRPMMVGADTELVLMTTPFGKRGIFYDAWTKSQRWKKIEVIGQDIIGRYESEQEYAEIRSRDGIMACYSPRHDRLFLQEELDEMGEWWYRQEYGGEFMEPIDSVFNMADVMGSLVDDTPAISFSIMVDDTLEAMRFD